MGFDIRPISEINSFDYSLCEGLQNANTVKKNLSKTKFMVSGESINVYTQIEAEQISLTAEWSEPMPI